jgi:hypothetical protein
VEIAKAGNGRKGCSRAPAFNEPTTSAAMPFGARLQKPQAPRQSRETHYYIKNALSGQ